MSNHKHIINLIACLETEEQIRAYKNKEATDMMEMKAGGAAFAQGSKKRDEYIVNLAMEVNNHDNLIGMLKHQIKFYTDQL